ncbi:MAG: ABC transporter substrate-binding protein [Acidimicrobiales bacterium]
MKRQTVVVVLLFTAMVAAACGAKGADEAAKSGTTTTAAGGSGTTAEGGAQKFGTLPSPCGKGNATVQADEAGRGTDKLYIGVGNDREGIRPGLLKELWDGSLAFVKWCNDQGGINGLQLEAVDLDGKVLEVDKAMATACTDVFAIVGGGWAQDNLIFTGKDGADFHKCKMIAIPGFAVSTDFSEATDQVQPIPNPSREKPSANFDSLAALYPEKIKSFGVVYGNLPSITQNKDQAVGTAKQVKGYGTFAEISYDIISADWAVIAQQVIDQKLELVDFIGEPANLSKFSQALKDQGWNGVLTAETNMYDARLVESSGAAAVEGITVRSAFHPFEEADKFPATKQLVGILDKDVPGWQHAALAIQAFSAALLFGTVAKQCADEGPINRKCILEKAGAVHEWTGGGLHAASDPGGNHGPKCSMLVQVKNGAFERLYPKVGSKDDSGDGFHCGKTINLQGDFGTGNKDSSILTG